MTTTSQGEPHEQSRGERDALARRFQALRPRLHGVAYRVLGSAADADDAVQETWLRLSRSDDTAIDDLGAWLTTVVGRVALNLLRARRARPEPADIDVDSPPADPAAADPEREAELAESVGLAMLVVLDTLAPAERLAFVLHDLFDVPFDEIAPIVDRSTDAARQLASRARRRVRRAPAVPNRDVARQRCAVDAYLAATRSGDFGALLRILDPAVELRADATALPSGRAVRLSGAESVARGAVASAARALATGLALVEGRPGLVMAREGRLVVALVFTFEGERITAIDVIGDPARLAALDIAAPSTEPVPSST